MNVRRNGKTDTRKNRHRLFLALSMALHVLAGLFLWKAEGWEKKDEEARGKNQVEISFVEMKKKPLPRSRQVVESSLADPSDKSDENAYLGKQTQRVAKQTHAAATGSFREGRAGGSSARQSETNRSAQGPHVPGKGLSLRKLGLKHDLTPLGHLPPAVAAASSDHLREAEQGAQTLLNTKEFLYYSFFQRVRAQLEQFWEPNLRGRLKKMFDRGRSLASDREHSTHLAVYLNAEGEITKIEVEDTSGLVELDQAAIDSFNKAGPFPNPPKGMLGSRGWVKVDWTFVLRT